MSSSVDRRGSVQRPNAAPRPRLTGAIPFAGALFLALLLAAPVLAHADLVSSNPEDGAILATPPTVITLTFSEGVDAGKSSFKLTGPDGAVGTGKAAKDGSTVMTLDGLALGPGAYTIKWTSAAPDGHIARGTLGFTVSEPTPAPATPSPTPAATETPTDAASSEPTTAPSPAASAAPDAGATSSTGTDVLIPILVGLVLVAGVGVFVLRRSRGA